MGCASNIVKYLVFVFNLVFAIGGLVMLVIGVLYQLDLNDISNALDQTTYAVAPTLLIIVGAIVFIISFFGCCGAIRESTCMLTTYGVILLTIFILQIALGVFAFLQVKENNGTFKNEIYKAVDRAYSRYNTDTPTKEAIDTMQQLLHCCGSDSYHIFHTIPSSCCRENKDPCRSTDEHFFNEPCQRKLYQTLKDSVEILGYVALGLCVTELIAAIFSFSLSSSIRNVRRRDYYT